MIRDDVGDIVAATPRKRMTPTKTIPKSQQDPPTVYGVDPIYHEDRRAARACKEGSSPRTKKPEAIPVCVLGAAARSSLFGSADAIGQYVKANETVVPRDRGGFAATQFANRSGGSSDAGPQQHSCMFR